MKVTTDGCLFGAFSAIKGSRSLAAAEVLDIGTGTGLLALMYAQQNPSANIQAVEIDAAAAAQASENFTQSPWQDRLSIIHTNVQKLTPSRLYDIIISNPPFYEKQLASGNLLKNTAHHSSGLTLEELLGSVKSLLQPTGIFMVLMPYYREEEIIRLAAIRHLHPLEIVRVKQTPTHPYFRSMLLFTSYHTEAPTVEEIAVKGADGYYTIAFKKLLAAYYLHL